jgi:hypothetical protein
MTGADGGRWLGRTGAEHRIWWVCELGAARKSRAARSMGADGAAGKCGDAEWTARDDQARE